VDAGVVIEALNLFEQLGLGDGFGQVDKLTQNASLEREG
jgi:hypothetical protein